jgi:hypothetical protein
MPTQSERVVNRSLNGSELKSYLEEVFKKLLDNEGLLSPNIAYGRLGGVITLTLHLDNACFPESKSTIEFGEKIPMKDVTAEAEVAEQTAEFEMDNPNAERVRLNLPVPVETKQLDGTKQIEHILYPKEAVQDIPPAKVKVENTFEKAKKKMGL